jgi:septal ring-binding cell division protein DamX
VGAFTHRSPPFALHPARRLAYKAIHADHIPDLQDGETRGIMKTITSAIIAIAVTLAIGLAVGGNSSHAAADTQTQAIAPLTVNDLLRI